MMPLQVVAGSETEAIVPEAQSDSSSVQMKRLFNMFFNSSIFEIMIVIVLLMYILLLIL